MTNRMPSRAIAALLFALWGCATGSTYANSATRPSITQQPVDTTVTDGNSVRLFATATGKAPLTYQWLVGSDAIGGATTSTLWIPKAIYNYHNGRKYAVVVTDGNGATNTSNTAVLTISPIAPVITESPLSETVDAGSNAAFSVAAYGTLPLSYQWSRNGTPITGATSPQYATGAVTYAQNNRDWYTVTVTNGAGQSVTSPPAVLTISQWKTDADIAVDVSEADEAVAHQVTYRRGEVIAFDPNASNSSSSTVITKIIADVAAAKINLVTATLDLNSSRDQSFFDYHPGSSTPLRPDFAGSSTLTQEWGALRQSMSAARLPAVVQISGTPYVFSGQLDPDYEIVCGAAGNFYPLPLTGAPSQQVQSAVGQWIAGVSATIPDAIWIGTQEPTHTIGYSTAFDPSHRGCSSPDKPQLNTAHTTNIARFIAYWRPIAQELHVAAIRTGGIQLNAGDNPNYSYAAQRIISTGTPLDFFSIQNYNPSSAILAAAYATYEIFRLHPRYDDTKIIMDRYGLSLSGYEYRNASGMMHYLMSESQLMFYADMLYGYSVETSGLHESGTLLPALLTWLQSAPAPLRPLTTSNSDVQAFALIRTSGVPAGNVAIWNDSPSSTTRSVSLVLQGYPKALSPADVTVLKGSGQAITPFASSQLSIADRSIRGISLAPNEFLLISIR